MSYQPEERYWTDYLRIALPVMGLLLLIGLLWYWASDLIGDSADQPPLTPTPMVAMEPINAATPPPVPTNTPVPPQPTPGPPPAPTATVPAAPAVAAATTPLPQPDVEPTPAPEGAGSGVSAEDAAACAAASADYATGTTVVTTAVVNLREGPSVDTNPVTQIPDGTQLTVSGTYNEQGQCDWWPVTNPATNQSGFVREDFLRAADGQ